jgi:hypothetical protein
MFGEKFVEISEENTVACVVADKGDYTTLKTRYLLKKEIFANQRFRLDIQCESSKSYSMVGIAEKSEDLEVHPYQRNKSYFMALSGGNMYY